MKMPRTIRRRLIHFRRRIHEWCGSDRYSKPALHELDDKLEPYLPQTGFFVEAGGNDGYRQSNTYYLEKFKGWSGILIEPIPRLAARCRRERPNSEVFVCALVPPEKSGTTVSMYDSDLMSLVEGAMGSKRDDRRHVGRWLEMGDEDRTVRRLDAKGRTLSSVLDQVDPPPIDFLSLDVEGYEAEVLRGLNFSCYRPTYILVEANAEREVKDRLAGYYELVDQLSHHDLLFRAE